MCIATLAHSAYAQAFLSANGMYALLGLTLVSACITATLYWHSA